MPNVRIEITNKTVGTAGEHWPAGHVATVTEAQARDYIGNNKAVPAGIIKKATEAVKEAVKVKVKKKKKK